MTILTRRAPGSTVSPLADDSGFPALMRRMFNEPVFTPFAPAAMQWSPAVEISETNEALAITAELPGMNEKEIHLSVENNVLTISGEKEMEATDTAPASKYYVAERFYGAFQRSFTLPRSVDAEHVKAEFSRGVLTVTLPKLAQSKGRVIPVITK